MWVSAALKTFDRKHPAGRRKINAPSRGDIIGFRLACAELREWRGAIDE